MVRKVFCLLLLCLPWAALQADEKSDLFNRGLMAAAARDWVTLSRVQKQLGDNYPLNVYLDYQKLRAGLDGGVPAQVIAFRQAWPDTPLADRLLSDAIQAYARTGRWQALSQLTDTPPNSLSLRCNYVMAQAKAHTRDVQVGVESVLKHTGSMPSSCQNLFRFLATDGQLDRDTLLLLMQQAFQHGQEEWMKVLAAQLPEANQQKIWLLRLYRSPADLDAMPARVVDRQSLVVLALERWARRDPKAALAWWQNAHPDTFTDEQLKQQAAARIAWYSIINSEQPNRQWLDAWLREHPVKDVLEQRVRRAISEQNWPSVLEWIGYMQPSQREEAGGWDYWLARAQAETGQVQEAEVTYRKASAERSFYGFLAASRLAQPFSLNESTAAAGLLQLNPAENAALARVRLLLLAGHESDARMEWAWLLKRTDTINQQALARYALRKQWYSLAVATAIQTNQFDQLSWRFPLAWKEDFESAAKRHGQRDGYLMMAVARRESAFYPQAKSPVGALGLMQLMPETAKRVAASAGLRVSREDLLKLDSNLKLGSRYLDSLLRRYQGNQVLALAAYNAGPQRVDKWLGSEAVPADVWIESIPFKETREYVKAVLAYRVIFMRRDGIADGNIDMLGNAARDFAYTRTALADVRSVKAGNLP